MKLKLEYLNITSFHALNEWIKEQTLMLGRTRQIDEARVRLVRSLDSSPAFQVNVHLVTPGPDLFAESRDHTLRAAFAKALAQLRAQIAGRGAKRLRRLKSKFSVPRLA